MKQLMKLNTIFKEMGITVQELSDALYKFNCSMTEFTGSIANILPENPNQNKDLEIFEQKAPQRIIPNIDNK